MHAESLPGGSLARKTEKGTKRTLKFSLPSSSRHIRRYKDGDRLSKRGVIISLSSGIQGSGKLES
jgi:hypothetical protein